MLRMVFLGYPTLLMVLVPILAGCRSGSDEGDPQPPAVQVGSDDGARSEGISLLDEEVDRLAARQQEICPVSGEPLGSMGKPIKLTVEGREVFICCAGCEGSLRENPEKYFGELDQTANPLE